jgi:cytochrome b subunit of formate dehydrogenase
VEKFDYWAVYWGIVIMVGSGLLLWSPELAMRYLPKYALDIAQAVHSDEALLAAAAIIIWHFYNVHFNPECFPMNWAWLTGRISRKRMRKHHPLEYERLLGGGGKGAADRELAE